MRKSGIDCGSSDDSDKRQPVCKSDNASFFVFIGPMLDQRIDGNDEESTRKSERGQQQNHLKKCQSMQGYGKSKQRHADGSERNEAILDLPRGKQARGVAAKADADG